jgi:uncharacterized protein (DUF2147 family)
MFIFRVPRTGKPIVAAVCLALVGLTGVAADAPSASVGPNGPWLTENRSGVIAFAPCGGGLCGRIAGMVLDRPDDPTPVDYAGRPECGLPIIDDAAETEPGLWSGHITDPRNGWVYHVRLWTDAQGRLHLRGYILIPLLGKTQIWTRYVGTLPADCRLTAADVARRGPDGG